MSVELDTSDHGYDEGAILGESGVATAHALALLYDRVIAGLSPDGSIRRNTRHMVGVEQEDGTIVPFGDIAQMCISEDPYSWEHKNTAISFPR